MFRLASMNARFVRTRTESVSHRDYVMNRALSLVAGQRRDEVEELCSEVVPRIMKRRLNSAVAAAIRKHSRNGEQTWLVTASPVELAEHIATELGMTGALGTQAAHIGGVYTGELAGPILHGQNKAAAVSVLAGVEGLELGRCSAYSDSINDLPLLTLVGHPVVVNANRRLQRLANRNGWGIMATSGWVTPTQQPVRV